MATRTKKAKRKPTAKADSTSDSPNESGSQAAIIARLNGLIFMMAEALPRSVPDSEKPARGKKNKPLSKSEELNVRLAKAGLGPTEIAQLTGRARNNISRDLSKARKQGRLPRAK